MSRTVGREPTAAAQTAEQVREMVTKGACGGQLFFAVDDARATRAELKEG